MRDEPEILFIFESNLRITKWTFKETLESLINTPTLEPTIIIVRNAVRRYGAPNKIAYRKPRAAHFLSIPNDLSGSKSTAQTPQLLKSQ
jgi:hypothetical protein